MNKPSWMKCATCLFFQKESISPGPSLHHVCMRDPKLIGRDPEWFCDSWTCRNCLQSWKQSAIHYNNEDRVDGYQEFIFTNHHLCYRPQGIDNF